ncbi:MAG: cytochrome B [Geoalkalibacter sp.]|jgi:coenzyme F420-reducing hydrogenase gamma subunit|uniref:NADH-quinone oxidoreductase subunit B family protein n=1 Tax=Geoalkalibacter sp. TaxID=3041440 RepID=UPI002A9A434A|nr:cytochrome B [Thermodesulfobacteriota bacterium]
MMGRPKIAFFDLSSCEGCQLQIANLGETLLDILGLVELIEFREIMSEKWAGRYDIAFVEGSVVNPESEERLREIRERCNLLIAYGSCATIGGVNGMKNRKPLPEVQSAVYGDKGDGFPASKTRALHQLVKVDYFIHGCPIYPDEFLRVLKSALAGLPYQIPDYAVCVECKFNENICMYDKGVTCLGPVTRAGCNSWCVNQGNLCYGCRGMVSNPNRAGAEEVLRSYQLDARLIANKMTMYSAAMEQSDE